MTMTKSLVRLRTVALCGVFSVSLSACVTSRVEDARVNITGLNDGESVVIMAKSYHQGNETEADYIRCVENALGRGSAGLRVIPNQQFVDSLFPWFEPRTAPAETKGLSTLMKRPGVAQAVADMGVRYIIWLDGDTERVAQGGSLWYFLPAGAGGSDSPDRENTDRRVQRPGAAATSLHSPVRLVR